MQVPARLRRSPLAGSVVVLSDVSTAMGAAVCHRLAPETVALVLAGRPGPRTLETIADARRVRSLNRIEEEPLVVLADPATEDGAREIHRAVAERHGQIDVLVHVAAASEGGGLEAIAPLFPLLHHLSDGLLPDGSGRLLLGLDLLPTHPARAARGNGSRVDAAFDTLVRSIARSDLARKLCVNGVLLDEENSRAEHTYLLAAGRRAGTGSIAPHASAYSAAAGVMTLLAAATSKGITGQLFRVGHQPPDSDAETDVAEYVASSLRL